MRHSHARIILTGTHAEQHITAAVRQQMRGPSLDLAGRTDLGTLAALIKRLDLLVTNDTGASHIAAATRTPSIILFGPDATERWAPLDRNLHRAIDAKLLAGRAVDAVTALQLLPVEPVFAACEAMLSSSRKVKES